MTADYTILAIVAVISIGGGLFLLHQAKQYRARLCEDGRRNHHDEHEKSHTLRN